MKDLLVKWLGIDRAFKTLFNLSPMYRSTGGKIIECSDNLKKIRIRLKLSFFTKNYVGTLYGGHIYSCVDGLYMVQLINLLGKNYVVWDKSAAIRFKRPGNQTLYADFEITDEFLENVKSTVQLSGEKDFTLTVLLKDNEGKVYAEVDKVIYIAEKHFYTNKKKAQLK